MSISGLVNRHHAEVIAYLVEENQDRVRHPRVSANPARMASVRRQDGVRGVFGTDIS